jgi:hypothetical protein
MALRSDESAAVGAFSLDYAGTDCVDPDLLRAELAGQHASDGVDGSVTWCQISVRPGISWFAVIPVGSPGCYVAAVA